jgi:hypothetical protein
MRLLLFTASVAIAASVSAQPHVHRHRHLRRAVVKRDLFTETVYEPGPVGTITVFLLNGQQISEDEVNQGIKNGTLVWGDDGNLSTSAAATSTSAPIPSSSKVEEQAPASETTQSTVTSIAELHVHAQASSAQAVASSSSMPEPSKEPEPQPSHSSAPSSQSGGIDGLDREFENGQYNCDSIPEGFGAMPVEHAGLGGWIGIQAPQADSAAGYDDITTVPHGSCPGGKCCQPGSFCSYSCPTGYLKSSWPTKQGATGQSIGGLYCNTNGFLELADGAVAKTLCVKGTDKVTIKVQNNLSVNQSICRTDYPGMSQNLQKYVDY